MERETLEDDKISDNEMRLEDEGISDIPPEESQPHRLPKRKDTYKRSKVWDHFIAYTDGEGKPRAKCKYCERNYAADPCKNGTSTMNNHLKVCKKHPGNTSVASNQTITSFCQTMDVKESCSHVKFDQEALRQGLARMIIMDELPFKFVENEGFRQFISLALPQFVIPSRTTITRDCYKLFFDEKRKLINYFKSSGQRISLTTDTWTSNQRLTYMCLTAHYIDSDWKMHKVILNFIPCTTYRGDDVGLLIEKCLLDWGIDKVFAITVDNASSNDTTIAYLIRRFINWGTAILDGKYLHMRCVAHIINLIVKDGLKELNDSIERVRTVVRYVRQSPARTRKFNDYVVEENIQSKKSLCLDVPTRWNSVYMMLETALIFEGVFERYEIYDADFRNDFRPGGSYGKIGLPLKHDWVMVRKFVKVLRYFYDLTNRVSGSLYVTSNNFLDEISDVDDLLKEWINGDDVDLVDMARQMKAKFDKYWGNIEKMNMMLYVAVMLDPRHKFFYLRYVFKNVHGPEMGEKMGDLAKSALYDVFEEYKKMYSSTTSHHSTTLSSESSQELDDDIERTAVRDKRKKMETNGV
ncbi:UNVERIFIED_CONTAM: Zinc finger BED domain-containing protein RICESLEEPER 2 [Sesamum radiatum]|uniref:Zinc finger BED domain-containing protein RICESLEEPER 2 n=1 Tax=Sesamum radiatum TaxID=300843 RepID=A0AAW2MCH4_SESRA